MKQENVFEVESESFTSKFYYQTPASKLVYNKSIDLMMKLLKANSEDKILDIGCGNGALVNRISQATINVSGIDSSPGMISMAQRDYPHLNYRVEDALAIKEKDESFDKIVSRAVFQHLEGGHQEFMEEAYRILRKNGTFVLFVPFESLFMKPPRFVSEKIFSGRKKIQGQMYNLKFIKDSFKKAGFKIENIKFYGGFFYLLSGYGTGLNVPFQQNFLWNSLLGIDKLFTSLPTARLYSLNVIIKARK